MLLGIIKDITKNIEYYINSEKKDNVYEISFTMVTNDNIKALSKEEIRSLLKTILSSNLTYKEKWNDYDVYLDEANNKRYFKNGRENFFMFLENNGVSAINYFNKISKTSKSKSYNIIAANIAFSLILSSMALIPFAGDIQIRERLDITVSSFINLSADDLVNSIQSSKYLTDEEKEFLCNEDYFNFVLENSDPIRNYSLRKAFNDMRIERFDESVVANCDGYYDHLHPNTIYILDKNYDDDVYRGMVIHEFIHATQDCDLSYIQEATTEICKNEFWFDPMISYNTLTKRAKVLAEIIGPEPLRKCLFSGKNDKSIRNAVKEYLSPEEVNDFLSLLDTPATKINDPNYDLEDLNKKIDDYLAKIYYNKTGKDIKNSGIINAIYNNDAPGRIYFNHNHEKYNTDYYTGTTLELIGETDINSINPDDIESYNYSIRRQEEVDGDNLVHIERKTTTDPSIIESTVTDSTQVRIDFKDGTIGYVNYEKNTNSWGSVKQYKSLPPSEPSIPKKFPDQVKESINVKTIPEKVECEAKTI